jgi:O-antigen/teichoic acid export membrane protein
VGDARRLVRNLLSLSTGEVMSRLIGFTAFALLARRLRPDDYGAVEFAVALALFFAMVVDFGLETIGARSIVHDRAKVGRLAAQIPAARLLIAVVAVPVMGGVAIITAQPEQTVRLVWLVSLGLLAVPWFQRWLFQGLEMMDWVSLGQVIRSAVFCLGVVVFVRGPGDILSVGGVEVLAAAAATAFYLLVQQRKVAPVRLDFSAAAIRGLYRESASVGLSQIVWASNQYLSTVLVAALASAVELSWFGAAQRIVFAVVAFSWVYHFNLFPSLSRNLVESRSAFDALVRASFRIIAWLGILVSLACVLFASLVMRAVFGDAYAAAAGPLAILAWAIPVTLLSGHARITLIAGNEQRFVFASQLAGLMTTVLVGLATIPRYGALAGAATTLASYLVVWIAAHVFTVRRIAPLPLLGVLRPLAVATIVYALREVYAPASVVAGVAALAAYALLGPLVDRSLMADMGRLLAARHAEPRVGNN